MTSIFECAPRRIAKALVFDATLVMALLASKQWHLSTGAAEAAKPQRCGGLVLLKQLVTPARSSARRLQSVVDYRRELSHSLRTHNR